MFKSIYSQRWLKWNRSPEKINQTEKQMNMLKTKVKKQIKNFKI
jgi:hypothetical protein